MPIYGEWRTDSVPFWAEVGRRNTSQAGWRWASTARTNSSEWDADPRVADAWAGTGGELAGPTDATAGPSQFDIVWNNIGVSGSPTGSWSTWAMRWVTITRYDPTPTVAALPSSVYDSTTGTFVDPNVVGVEWGTSAALSQRLRIVTRAGWRNPADLPAHVKNIDEQQPAFMTGGTVAAIPDLGTIPAGSGSVTIADPPVATSGADTLTIGLLDHYTHTQTTPTLPPGESYTLDIDLQFDAYLEAQVAPPYRLIYQPARVPHLRVVQRGSDGLGVTGGRRIVGNRTLQASNRALGIR